MAKKTIADLRRKHVNPRGPYLNLAVICENVLEDKDGAISIIRIVDKFTVSTQLTVGNQTVQLENTAGFIQFQAVIGFKAGNARGCRLLKLIVWSPSRQVVAEATAIVELQGGGVPGHIVRTPIALVVKEPGIYWVDVTLNENEITRMPLQVVFGPPEAGTMPQTNR